MTNPNVLEQEVHVGDVGTIFRITVIDENDAPIDVSAATERKIFLRSPDDTVTSHDADVSTSGSDGKMEYVSQSGDIYQAGTWRIQGKVVITEGTFYTDIGEFVVEKSLADA